MSANATWKHKSPLEGYESAPPLPTTLNADGKSLDNGTLDNQKLSDSYERFPDPIDSSNNGFDFHVYYNVEDEAETKYARELHERVRREWPELRIYRFWDRAVGPHPKAMFEVNTFTPHQTGAFFSWLTVNRGPCPVLIHPNTDDEYRDHTELCSWMGGPLVLNTDFLVKP
ncbi:DOPA-like domain-containing protein [Coprinopsis sp. MPI-PUGE-AT-0042]|nr:DOPA-like domain-containing protein [Coprinopsis sp. MPI-PUGE-AT-0042]